MGDLEKYINCRYTLSCFKLKLISFSIGWVKCLIRHIKFQSATVYQLFFFCYLPNKTEKTAIKKGESTEINKIKYLNTRQVLYTHHQIPYLLYWSETSIKYSTFYVNRFDVKENFFLFYFVNCDKIKTNKKNCFFLGLRL